MGSVGSLPASSSKTFALVNGDLLEPEECGDGDDDCGEANEPLQQSGDILRKRLAAAVFAPDVRIHVL